MNFTQFFRTVFKKKQLRVNVFASKIRSHSFRAPEDVVQRCSSRDFSEFTGKHLCQSLFFNKVAGIGPATVLKKRFWHRCFPVNFEKFVRTHLVAASGAHTSDFNADMS